MYRGILEEVALRLPMRQNLQRVPKERIAVLIGAKGATRRQLEQQAGRKRLVIDCDSGDNSGEWPVTGEFDPVKALKLSDVIKAIGRGMSPEKAMQLLQDDWFFEIVDLRTFVGKRQNQLRRVRSRLIGSKGRIRRMIESLTGCEISIYNSTVVIVGDELGLAFARQSVEMIASGSEHGTVLSMLEKGRKRQRIEMRSLDAIETVEETSSGEASFAELVPGLDRVAAARKLKAAQVNTEDEEEVEEVMWLSDDEKIAWEEE